MAIKHTKFIANKMTENASIIKLEEKVGGNWSAIKQAYSDAAEKEEQISGLLKRYYFWRRSKYRCVWFISTQGVDTRK